jgi:hypothetical protein
MAFGEVIRTRIRCESGFNFEVMWSAMLKPLFAVSWGKTGCFYEWRIETPQGQDSVTPESRHARFREEVLKGFTSHPMISSVNGSSKYCFWPRVFKAFQLIILIHSITLHLTATVKRLERGLDARWACITTAIDKYPERRSLLPGLVLQS